MSERRPIDGLRGDERRRALRALADDPAGREALTSEDPSKLFALLGAAPIPEPLLDEVSHDVSRAVRRRTAGRWVAWGGLAAGLLLALLLGVSLRQPAVGPAPLSADSGGPERGAAVPLEDRGDGPGKLQLTLAGPQQGPQVFDLAVGDVQVVMIFNEGLEL